MQNGEIENHTTKLDSSMHMDYINTIDYDLKEK